MGGYRILFSLVFLCCSVGVKSMTLRDLLQEKLHQGPKPSSWNIDIALATLINTPPDANAIPESSMAMLKDIFQFLPDGHPTVINQILKGKNLHSTSEIFQVLLDKNLDDIGEMLRNVQDKIKSSCRGSGLSVWRNTLNETIMSNEVRAEKPSQYDECVETLQPMLMPPIAALLRYVKNTITPVRESKHMKWEFGCTFTLRLLETGIDLLLKQLDAFKFPDYGLDMLDMLAKPPAAITGGQVQWVGGAEMCNELKVSYTPENAEQRTFNGRYCRVMVGQASKFNDTTNTTKDGFFIGIGFGICFPDTCTADGVMDQLTGEGSIVNTLLGGLGLEVRNVFCGNDLDFNTDSRAQLAYGIILTLIIIVAIATVYDSLFRPSVIEKWASNSSLVDTSVAPNQNTIYFLPDTSLYPDQKMDAIGNTHGLSNGDVNNAGINRQWSGNSMGSLISNNSNPMMTDGQDVLYERPSFLDRIEAAFVGFSASATFGKVFDVTNLGQSHLGSLSGLRLLSTVFAFGGNTCLFGIIYTESITVSNLVHKLAELPNQLAFQPVINYTFSTDSFLVVSGTLVSYHWLRRLHKSGGRLTLRQLLHFYLHRYWSLMPTMMLSIMLYTCLYKYLLSGPLSPPQIQDAENCRTSWWGNLLLINNLVNKDASCFAWSWYAPMLFQLHIITPIILIPLSYKRWAGWISLTAMYLVFLAIISAVVKTHIYGDPSAWYFDYIQTPWCRAGPYLIGIAVGIILHERYFHNIQKHIVTTVISILLMIMAVGTIIMLMLITYTKYRKDNPVKWTEDQTISYQIFSRSAWGLAIAYIILASETGFGGLIKSTISHSCMIPPSRIAYPVFLIHAIFIFKNAYSQYTPIYINFHNLLYIFFGHLIYIFILGMLIGVIFTSPFQSLEFAFFGAKTKLDIITAGSCEQIYRRLNLNRDVHHEFQKPIEDEPKRKVTVTSM